MQQLPLITIERFIRESFGTYGTLSLGEFRCFTIERPDLGNTPWLSCIPEGLYKAHRGEFSRGRPPYPNLEIEDVPGRSGIEVHGANLPDELNGCIALAEALKWQTDAIRGTYSKRALQKLLAELETDEVYILIR